MEAKNEMNNDVHEIKQLDGTRIGFILKGIVVGILVGFVVSLFRLGIEKLANKSCICIKRFTKNPFGWFLGSYFLSCLLIY